MSAATRPAEKSGRLRQALLWAGAGIAAVPAATLLHELGHYTVYRVFAFSGVNFHSSSVGFWRGDDYMQYLRADELAAAAAIAPRWQAGLADPAGAFVSMAIPWLAVLYIPRGDRSQPLLDGPYRAAMLRIGEQ